MKVSLTDFWNNVRNECCCEAKFVLWLLERSRGSREARLSSKSERRKKEERKSSGKKLARDLRKKSKRSEISGSINSPSLSRADGFTSVPLYLLVHWPPPDLSLFLRLPRYSLKW